MFAAIGNFIGCAFLNALRGAAVPVRCPKCAHEFKPFAGHRFTHVSEIMGRFPCPKCGCQFGIGEDAKSRRETAHLNPPGPVARPAKTKIERIERSADELLFHIPPTGRGGGPLVMGVIWSTFMLPLSALFFFGGEFLTPPPQTGAKVFIGFFAAVGLGLVYAGLRRKFARHLLYLSPDLIRIQRQLLLRSTFDLKPSDVQHVKVTEFFRENESPVYGVEIDAGMRKIRFGSALRDEETTWLAWEIRNFLRHRGAAHLPEE